MPSGAPDDRHGPAPPPAQTEAAARTELLRFVVSEELAGRTLGQAVKHHRPELSWRQVYQAIRNRRVLVQGELWCDEARRLQAGEEVCVLAHSLPVPWYWKQVPVVYADADLVVVNKPAGLRSEPHRSERNWPLARRLRNPTLLEVLGRQLAPAADGKGPGKPAPLFPVHRLDKLASGLLVLARHRRAQEHLVRQFSARGVKRLYAAITLGVPRPGTIRTRLVRDRGDGLRGSSLDPRRGQVAITHVTVLSSRGGLALVRCELETGRTHQIRIHLAEQGTPVAGDPLYRRMPDGRVVEDPTGLNRLALHAYCLELVHPGTGKLRRWECPWPEELQTVFPWPEETATRFGA